MKFPRFHLSTLIIAGLALSFFLGLNLLRRPEERVSLDFPYTPIIKKQPLPRHDIYANNYRYVRFYVGWPWASDRNVTILKNNPNERSGGVDAVETEELKRIMDVSKIDQIDWSGTEFKSLAPTVHQYLAPFYNPEDLHYKFVTPSELAPYRWTPAQLATNAAVVLTLSLLLAAACEFILRRGNCLEKSSP